MLFKTIWNWAMLFYVLLPEKLRKTSAVVPWVFERLAVNIPHLYSVGDNWSSFHSRWKARDTPPPPKNPPSPSPRDWSLKVPFILQKRIEEHRSSTAPVGCHVAAGVLYPLEWSPCVFVHHTQLDPGTHGSMYSTVAAIDHVYLTRVLFYSFRVWCFVSSMASWMTRYFPT